MTWRAFEIIKNGLYASIETNKNTLNNTIVMSVYLKSIGLNNEALLLLSLALLQKTYTQPRWGEEEYDAETKTTT